MIIGFTIVAVSPPEIFQALKPALKKYGVRESARRIPERREEEQRPFRFHLSGKTTIRMDRFSPPRKGAGSPGDDSPPELPGESGSKISPA
jgi:hypothetical protein